MRIHLVAIDLDGTLLNSAKQITDTTAAILRTVRKTSGVHIVLASARPPRSVMPFYRLLDLDTPMINYNGALVWQPQGGLVLMHRPIPAPTAEAIVKFARTRYPQVVVSAEILDKWYTDRVDARYLTETARQCGPDCVAPLEQWLSQSVTKLLLLGEDGPLVQLERDIRTTFPHQVTMVQTEGYLLQIMHATVSKAAALKRVAADLGTGVEHVMAIGDNANDVGMLRWAGVGVAMANACPQALAAADYVTDHHDIDGAAHAIRRIILDGLTVQKRRKGR